MVKKYAVVVAGGSGSRMNSDLPKQFLNLRSIPVIVHTIRRFLALADQIIVVVPVGYIDLWNDIREQYFPGNMLQTALGGLTRTESVSNGLQCIAATEGLVAIHDAARPLVEEKGIEESYRLALSTGSGVLAVPLKDSIREWNGAVPESRDRTSYMLIQTPQTFCLRMLREAYAQIREGVFTDDASVFEAAGHTIHLVEGTYENIKITTPEDLYIAEAILDFQDNKLCTPNETKS